MTKQNSDEPQQGAIPEGSQGPGIGSRVRIAEYAGDWIVAEFVDNDFVRVRSVQRDDADRIAGYYGSIGVPERDRYVRMTVSILDVAIAHERTMTYQDEQPGHRVPSQIRAIVDRIGPAFEAMGDSTYQHAADTCKRLLDDEGAAVSLTCDTGGGFVSALAGFDVDGTSWLVWSGIDACGACPTKALTQTSLADAFWEMEEALPADRYEYDCEHVKAALDSTKAVGPSA